MLAALQDLELAMATLAMSAARRLLSTSTAAKKIVAPRSFPHQFSRSVTGRPVQVPHDRDTNAALKSLQQAQQPEFQEEAQDMPGSWVVKGLVLAMLTYIGMNVAPMMGENMVRHSVSLVKVKDPFMKRSGASRLAMIATDDDKRKRIVDAGGVKALLSMLETAADDDTRREAVTALAMLAHYDPAVEAIHTAGGGLLVNTLSESTTDNVTQEHCSALLVKLGQWNTNKS